MAQYTQRTQPMHSHVTWLKQNIKENIIAFDDTITICQLHLEFGNIMAPTSQPVEPIQPAQSSKPRSRKRSTATKGVQHNSLTCKNVDIAPNQTVTQDTKQCNILSEPSTSKATNKQGDKHVVKDMELYYKDSDIERQVLDIERSVSAHVIKKRRISQKSSNDAEEVQVISDDDDYVVEIKDEPLHISLDEIDDDRTRSDDEDVIGKIRDDEVILKDGSTISRTTISIDPEFKTSVKEEPEDNGINEEEVIIPNLTIPTNLKDPLQVDIETVKAEPKNEMVELEDESPDLEDGGADREDEATEFEDEESELRQIKEESSDNAIDIGETVIQTIASGNNELDNILSTLVQKNFMTVKEKNYLSTSFDMNCILNVKYEFDNKLKVFAQQLYLCSEEAYNYMRNYIPCLPSVKLIKETFITWHGAPGFSAEAIDCLKMKVRLKKNKTKYVICSLAIHDIELKATTTRKKHKVAFIITAVALNASWKLPICYFIGSALMHSRIREQLIQLAISIVQKSGVNPKAVSYLPIFQNIEMAERLVKDSSNKNMFFSVSGKPIDLIPDPVYIFDKFRICGCEDKDGLLISLRHIELLVKHLARVRPGKVTNRLLGKSLAFSLEVCADDFLSSGLANVQGTVMYLKLINRFLDIMTSHPGGTYWKEALSGKNMRKVVKFLEHFKEYLSKISPKYKSNPFWLNNTSRGQLKFDTRSVMDILSMAVCSAANFIKSQSRANGISIKKLTMNSTTFLTNFYDVVDNGELKEKTVTEFTARYKKNLECMKPRTTRSGYILPIENISVLDITSPIQRINITTYLLNSNNVVKNKQFEKDTANDLYKILKYDARGEYTNLTKIYIAGYVVYNLVRRLRCDTCISALLRLNQRQENDPYNTELVIKKTEQDSSDKLCVKLMDPSADVVRICNATDVVFKRAMLQSNADKFDILERFSIPLLMLKIKKDMIGRDYFKSLDFHRHDTDTLENHVVELAIAVAEVYLEIRLMYRTSFIDGLSAGAD